MIIAALRLGPGMDHYVAIGAGDISGEQSLAQLNGAVALLLRRAHDLLMRHRWI
jgi:hypothetical protein